jgi:HEAT repeat protein
VVEAVSVDEFEGGEVVSMSAAQLHARLVDRLSAAKFVLLADGARAPDGTQTWRVQLAAGLTEPDVEAKVVDVRVVLRLASRHGDAEGFEVSAHERRPLPSNDVEAIAEQVRQALDTSLGQAIDEAHALIELGGATDEALVARLGQGNAPAQNAAVRLLARRKHHAALSFLVPRLKSDDVSDARQAIGLLVELGAPEAVNPMIEAAEGRGRVVQREVLFAVSAIGGEDAEAYLDLVANGHDEPEMRDAAAQALAELKQRKRPVKNGDKP